MSEAVLKDFPSFFSVKDKVAVVTGGSRGLGLSAASALLQSGASKVFITSRSATDCAAAAADLLAQPNLDPGAQVIPIAADVSTLTGIRALVASVAAHTSHVNILLANAGVCPIKSFDKHTDDDFTATYDLHVRGVFHAVREFMPLLTKRAVLAVDPARVIVTSSITGLGTGSLGDNATFAYATSKAAVLHLVRDLAAELGPSAVAVNAICPGFVPTKMTSDPDGGHSVAEYIVQRSPARRHADADDVAGAIVYLASRAGASITGESIAVDGGYRLV